MSMPDMGTYIGEFKNGNLDGNGTMKDTKGIITYIGEWKNNLKNGYGKEYTNGILLFEGQFKDGKAMR
jgi:antitoxin component YwqK of YwqJK toxin-antitoxin module